MATQQAVFKLGMSTVLVPDEEFADGYANGLVAYPKDQDIPLTVKLFVNSSMRGYSMCSTLTTGTLATSWGQSVVYVKETSARKATSKRYTSAL